MSRVSDLLDAAKAATGFDNFGDDGFREGLEILVESADREARLNDAGRAMFDGQCTLFLSRRLEIEDWYARHPEIDDEEIVAPLMVLGLPRTGSTALHCLLGEDPAVRVMRNWECMMPCPPPEAETYETDPRIALMDEQMKLRDKMTPRMKQMLPSTATSPTEDQVTMGFDFKSQMFQASFRIPTYVEWFNTRADLVPTFEYVKRVLKLLQWRCPPKRWYLKTPVHTYDIEPLLKVFPDANFVWTHREPLRSLSSVCSLIYHFRRAFVDNPNPEYLGHEHRAYWTVGLQRALDARERLGEDRFHDVYHRVQIVDPSRQVRELYAKFGWPYPPEMDARIAAWQEEHPKGKHDARPEFFGLDPDAVNEEFRFYTERFGL